MYYVGVNSHVGVNLCIPNWNIKKVVKTTLILFDVFGNRCVPIYVYIYMYIYICIYIYIYKSGYIIDIWGSKWRSGSTSGW